MLIAFVSSAVRAAAAAVPAKPLGAMIADDLVTALTVLAHAPTLADLLTLRSLTLTRLANEAMSDYFLGTPTVGVTFRPVDARGRAVGTTHSRESLMTVTAIAIRAIGQSREEALTA